MPNGHEHGPVVRYLGGIPGIAPTSDLWHLRFDDEGNLTLTVARRPRLLSLRLAPAYDVVHRESPGSLRYLTVEDRTGRSFPENPVARLALRALGREIPVARSLVSAGLRIPRGDAGGGPDEAAFTDADAVFESFASTSDWRAAFVRFGGVVPELAAKVEFRSSSAPQHTAPPPPPPEDGPAP